MQYTKLGDTGVNVSRLGFGCMRLPMTDIGGEIKPDEDAAVQLLRSGFEQGINYFDTAYFYHDGISELLVGKAMKGIRDRVVLATKSPGGHVKKPGDYLRLLEEQLKKLDTDYIDFYHFHGINYNNFFEVDERGGWYKEALRAKEEGLIRHIAFSFHAGEWSQKCGLPNPESAEMIKLIDTGYFESVLCQYNLLDRSNEAGIAHAKAKGLGIVVMGPLGGGRVSGLPKEVSAKLGIEVAASAELGLRFVASNPNVDIILSGMSNETQLSENVGFVSNIAPLSVAELDGIERMLQENKRLSELYCTGCNYCMPCPQEVNIPFIFQQANYYKIYGITDFARNNYKAIGTGWIQGKRADTCNECGACEKKCPQNIKIREQLKESHAILG